MRLTLTMSQELEIRSMKPLKESTLWLKRDLCASIAFIRSAVIMIYSKNKNKK